MRKAIRILVAVFLAVTVLSVVLVCYRWDANSADERVRFHFKMERETPLSAVAVREAVLRSVPLGTHEGGVAEALKELGIGRDRLSHYYPPSERSKDGFVRIALDPTTSGFVKNEYLVILRFEGDKVLTDVEVKRWATGL